MNDLFRIKMVAFHAAILLCLACSSHAVGQLSQSVDSLDEQAVEASGDAMPFGVRPGVRFLTPTSAEIRWETTHAGPAAVAFGPGETLTKIVTSEASGTSHRVVIEDLIPGQKYRYRFGLNQDGKRLFSPSYQLDGSMNYTVPTIEVESDSRVKTVVERLDQLGGFAVVIGSLSELWGPSLAKETQMTVIAGVDDTNEVRRLRQQWYEQGVYGIRLSAQIRSGVPVAFANLVVARTDAIETAKGIVAPLGKIILIGDRPMNQDYQWDEIGTRMFLGQATTDPELAEWGHQYGTGANASYSGERLGGVDDTSQLEVKWIGRPGADFGIDRNPRMPAPLAVGGRLFHQGMNRMIALDAFNGAVLWSLEIPDLRRVNIPRDSGNWCADRDRVYAAVKDRLWVIDASSGEMMSTMLLPEEFSDGHEWGYVAVTDRRVIGTVAKKDSGYSVFWGKSAWYDGKDDAATAKVCGNAIVGYDKDYGSIDWLRTADAIVHSTITVSNGRVFFVEVDDPSLKDLKTGKLTNDRIWNAAKVVCLDVETGAELWTAKVPAQDHEAIVSFGFADANQFVLQTSGKGQFHFVSLDAMRGEQRWMQSADWPEDHHGAHVQHAVLMNGKIFVQPHIIDAVDGRVIQSETLGKRRGCATPIGAGNSIIYRGGSGPLSLWSLEKQSRSEFTRLRPSCWLSTIPAQGMLFSPEGGGGCSCGGWMETSMGFAPHATLNAIDAEKRSGDKQ